MYNATQILFITIPFLILPAEQEALFTVIIIAEVLLLRMFRTCLLYTSDAADERSSVDLGGRRIIKKKKQKDKNIKKKKKRDKKERLTGYRNTERQDKTR